VFIYDPATGRAELPWELERWRDQLQKEAASARITLQDWGGSPPPDPVVVGLWLHSHGGHGPVAVPGRYRLSVEPAVAPDSPIAVFRDVPLSAQLLGGATP